MNGQETIYITPKGYLFKELSKETDISIDKFCEIWDGLADYIDQINSSNNLEGIPGILFDTDGGTPLSVTKNEDL